MKNILLRALPWLGAVVLGSGPVAAQTAPTSRNPALWPFSAQSIWNMPIGSGAVYVAVKLPPLGLVNDDPEYIYRSSAADPLRPVHLVSGDFAHRVPSGETPSYVSVHIADNLVVPDATADPYSTPNNAAAFIEPDGTTVYELEPLTRPVAGGRVYAYNASRDGASTQDIKGPGAWGAHFGSSLSTLGGSIRAGEMTGPDPIRHAIKLEFDTEVLWKNSTNPAQSYRWPAFNADGYTGGYGVYNKTDKALVMGALLAIPPAVTAASLSLQTAQGRKIFAVLQDYGAYIVDTSGSGYQTNGGYTVNVCAEKAVSESEFSFLGYPGQNDAWFADFKKLVAALKVVNNNTATTVGGGGTPRQALAPPFASGSTPPPTSGGTFAGVYKLTARHSGKALDVDGVSGADGANVHQWGYESGANQQWKIEGVGGGYYKLTAQHSGKCLDVNGGGTANGTNVLQWGYGGGANQQWAIEATDGGYYKLLNRNSGKALDVDGVSGADGANVHQWEYVGGANQQWKIESVAARPALAATSPAVAQAVALYPNPAAQTVTVTYTGPAAGPVRLEIFDALGRAVLTREAPAQAGANALPVPLPDVPNGLYWLRLTPVQGPALTQRLLIAH